MINTSALILVNVVYISGKERIQKERNPQISDKKASD